MEERIKELENKVDQLEKKLDMLTYNFIETLEILTTLKQVRDEDGNYDLKYIDYREHKIPGEVTYKFPEITSFVGKPFSSILIHTRALINQIENGIRKEDE